MKSFEIGDEVVAVVLKPVPKEETRFAPNAEMNTVIKSSVKNRTEPDENPLNFIYELSNHEGSVPAGKIFDHIDAAKIACINTAKNSSQKEFIVKSLES